MSVNLPARLTLNGVGLHPADAPRGSHQSHVILRFALEGVPVAAIARSFRQDASEIEAFLKEQREQGNIAVLPAFDWRPSVDTQSAGRQPTQRPVRAGEMAVYAPLLAEIYRLTGLEARLLAALMVSRTCSKEHLHMIACSPDSELKIVDVVVCKLRAKLKDQRLVILTQWGVGYRLEDGSRRSIIVAMQERERLTVDALERRASGGHA